MTLNQKVELSNTPPTHSEVRTIFSFVSLISLILGSRQNIYIYTHIFRAAGRSFDLCLWKGRAGTHLGGQVWWQVGSLGYFESPSLTSNEQDGGNKIIFQTWARRSPLTIIPPIKHAEPHIWVGWVCTCVSNTVHPAWEGLGRNTSCVHTWC